MRLRNVFMMAAAMAMGVAASAQAADSYKIDPAHSSLGFKIKHLDVSYINGLVSMPKGTVEIADKAEEMKFDVTAEISNLSTGVEKRDTHLKSADFFNAKEFPEMSFKSTAVKSAGTDEYEVTGDLKIHGVTKSVTAKIKKVGQAKTPMGERAGFESTFEIKRSDFGMTKMIGPAGDDVKVMVNLEAAK